MNTTQETNAIQDMHKETIGNNGIFYETSVVYIKNLGSELKRQLCKHYHTNKKVNI